MQPQTPQANTPAPPPPVTPPVPPQTERPEAPEQPFYTPAAPSSYPGQQAGSPKPQNNGSTATVAWDASEYVHIDKGGLWIIGFSVIVLVLVGIAIWLAAWTFAILIVVMAAAMAIFAFRPPRVLHYVLTNSDIQINNQSFPYGNYRAFGILQDGTFFTLTLIPVKRFSPALSIYFAEDHGEQIVDIIGAHLPMEHVEPDFIDSLMRRLRF